MMSQEEDSLLLNQTLEQRRPELGGVLTDALHPILAVNGQRGRLRYYLRLNPHQTIPDYIDVVVRHYQNDHDCLEQLQRQKSHAIWEPLLLKIRRWAYPFLGRWNLDEVTRITSTLEVTQETSLEIIRAHYPYDCEFDAWACIITHHVCSKYMQHHGPSPIIDNIDLSEVDEWFQGSDDLLVPNPEVEFANRQLLLDAIGQLGDKQSVVIWSYYFEGHSLPQIATHLQVNINAIYKLHFDALKRLRKIFENNQHKDE